MPTKPNRAGQQQNYVPKGNGDASGEYGDNATGSNKHFTNFKKPDETPQVEEVKATEQPKEEIANDKYIDDQKREWKSQQNHDTYISMITAGILKHQDLDTEIERDNFKDKLRNIFNNANTDSLSALSKTIDKRPFEFTEDRFDAGTSYFYEMMNQVHISKDSLNRGFENEGTTIFHELGHYMNASNKIKEKNKWYYTDRKLTDATTIFQDEISVADMLQIELKDFSANKYAPQIRKEKYKMVNELLKEHGFTAQEYEKLAEKQKDALASEEWQTIKERIKNDYDNGRYATVSDANKVLRERLAEWKKTGSYKDLFAEIAEKRPLYSNACNEWYKKSGIAVVSDAWSSKSDFGFGLGHSRSYYNKSYQNQEPQSLVADEFWANFFAAYTTNDSTILETTQKYFPQTYEKMVKLIDYLNDKKEKDL